MCREYDAHFSMKGLVSCYCTYQPQEMEPAIAFTIHNQVLHHRFEESSPYGEGSPDEEAQGPQISYVQPVDQYEFNARDWNEHR